MPRSARSCRDSDACDTDSVSAPSEPSASSRTVIVSTDSHQMSVVFEMRGETLVVPPFGHLRLVLSGPETEELTIGYGEGGLSIFRDEGLVVEVFDSGGRPCDVGLFR